MMFLSNQNKQMTIVSGSTQVMVNKAMETQETNLTQKSQIQTGKYSRRCPTRNPSQVPFFAASQDSGQQGTPKEKIQGAHK